GTFPLHSKLASACRCLAGFVQKHKVVDGERSLSYFAVVSFLLSLLTLLNGVSSFVAIFSELVQSQGSLYLLGRVGTFELSFVVFPRVRFNQSFHWVCCFTAIHHIEWCTFGGLVSCCSVREKSCRYKLVSILWSFQAELCQGFTESFVEALD